MSSNSSLALIDRVTALTVGSTLDIDALRKAHTELTNFQFARAFWRARQKLFNDRGLTLTKIRGAPEYVVDCAEGTIEKVDRKRLKVVNSARQYHGALVNAQKNPQLKEDDRTRLNLDEMRAARSAKLVEREFLLRRSR